jgi:acyl-CoA thioesterase-1
MTDLRVCFLGDSYVAGVGDSAALGWTGRVVVAARAKGHDLTAYNLGVRGETGADILARAPAETAVRLAAGDRKAMVIAFGANDIRRSRPLDESLASLDGLLTLARYSGASTFVISPPLYVPEGDPPVATLAAGMAQACATLDVPYLDVRAGGVDWPLWWRQAKEGDGAHPGAESYAGYAQTFAAWTPWRTWLSGAA